MQASKSNRIRCGQALRLALLGASLLPLLSSVAAYAAPPKTGVACTSGSGTSPIFTLDAKAGYIQLPDGNTAYTWGYAVGGGAFQHPGPVLCVNQGDNVTVVLNNALPEAVSIMFPGQVNVLANGALAQPQGTGASLSSLTDVAPAGGSVTYNFTAGAPGTYLYESGTNPQMQVRMGLFGALVVRPTGTGADYVNNRADSRFTTNVAFAAGADPVSEEYMVLLSEIDPYLNGFVELGMGALFDFNYYHPRYWLINGRGFPDSISDNYTPFLPDQPYGALARIHPFKDGKNVSADPPCNPALLPGDTGYVAGCHPYPGAIRYLNVGTETFPFHPHGNNGLVIGRDGMALEGAGGQDLSFEKFAINIGPGQTWDVTFRWNDAEKYDGDQYLANGTTPNPNYNPVPVTIPQVNNQEFGMFYSGSPYLGQTGTLPPGASTLNECGAYYIISHNHALFQITSWGVNMTGPITYVRVDPPLPNNCQ